MKRLLLHSGTGAALLAGCLVLVNLLGAQFHLDADLSAERLYSLSPGSRRILRGLSGPVEVRVYFSRQLPPEYAANRSYVRDLLQEYRDASRGKVLARFVDVEDEPGKNEALQQGISPVEFNVVTREKFELQQGLMGLALQHEDKKEVLPVVLKTEGLELDLTSRILRMSRPARTVVGLVSSHGAMGPEALHARVRELLERNYDLRPVDLSGLKPGGTVPADVAALLILGPTERFSEGHLYALDQFLMSGRPLVAALDSRRADLRSFMVSPLDTGLPELFRDYGLSLRRNFVLDPQCQRVQLTQQRGWLAISNVVEFPLLPVVTDLDRTQPVTRYLESLTLPLVSPIEVSSAPAAGRVLALARSSPMSWLNLAWERGAVHSINPLQGFPRDKGDPPGSFVLAVEASGPFTSRFSADTSSARRLPKGADPSAFVPRGKADGRLVLVGTSRFAHPDMPAGEVGAVFLMNLVDWMAMDSDLIQIRAKGAVFRPLRELSSHLQRAAIRWADVLGPSLLVAAFGFLRLRARRRLRLDRVRAYAPPARP